MQTVHCHFSISAGDVTAILCVDKSIGAYMKF